MLTCRSSMAIGADSSVPVPTGLSLWRQYNFDDYQERMQYNATHAKS